MVGIAGRPDPVVKSELYFAAIARMVQNKNDERFRMESNDKCRGSWNSGMKNATSWTKLRLAPNPMYTHKSNSPRACSSVRISSSMGSPRRRGV